MAEGMGAPSPQGAAKSNGRESRPRTGGGARVVVAPKATVEALFTKEILSQLEANFSLVGMTQTDLHAVLSSADSTSPVPRAAVDTFFAKVDVSEEGRITWRQLATFLHLTLVENEEATARARRVEFHLPAKRAPSPHVADPVVKCAIVPKSGLWSLSAAGMLVTWPAHAGDGALTPLSSTALEIGKQATGLEKAANAWTTDFVVLPEMAKLAIATGERRIYFCTMGGDFLTQFIVGDLPGVPMRVCTYFSEDLDATVLLFGDSEGALGMLVFPRYFWQSSLFRGRRDKSVPPRMIPASRLLTETGEMDSELGGVHLRMWRGHDETVSEMEWLPQLGMFASCSPDVSASMIIGSPIELVRHPPAALTRRTIEARPSMSAPTSRGATRRSEQQKRRSASAPSGTTRLVPALRENEKQTVFAVSSGGIRSMSFSHEFGLMATGGTDREIRLWSPTMSKRPSSTLSGHDAPILALRFQDGRRLLASVDSSRTVRVWNVAALVCVHIINEQAHKVHTDIECLVFSERINGMLLFPRHSVAYIELKKSKAPQTGFSHAAAVRCAVYNDRFAHLVTGGDDGLVRMWHAESGARVFEMRGWRRGNKSAVRAITLSEGGTQLITAMESGEINLWQYSTGQHVCRFVEAASTPYVSKVITVGWGNAHNVVTVGWSRRVSVFDTAPREQHVEVLRPVNLWRKDEVHSDDVTCLAPFGRNMAVTATYDGGIVVWNLSTGRPRRLSSRERMELDAPPTPMQEYVVFDLAVIESRVGCKDPNAAELIASTATGVYVWGTKAVDHGKVGVCQAQFWVRAADGTPTEARSIAVWEESTARGSASGEARLVSGDATGRITVFNITGYCAGAHATTTPAASSSSWPTSSSARGNDDNDGVLNRGAPTVLWSWQAHCQVPITSLVLRTTPSDSTREPLLRRSRSHRGGRTSRSSNSGSSYGRTGIAQRETMQRRDGNDGGDGSSNMGGAPNEGLSPSEGTLFVMSCSEDARARLWTADGSFVGTFGQEGLWDVCNKESWQAPDIPHDIREYDEHQVKLALANEMFEKNHTSTVRHRPAPAWGIDEDVSTSESEANHDSDDDVSSDDTSDATAPTVGAAGTSAFCGGEDVHGGARVEVVSTATTRGSDGVFNAKAFPFDPKAFREAVVKGEWGHISRMKYIGDGGATNLYARHRLDSDRTPAAGPASTTARVQSAPASLTRPQASKDYIESGLPRKIGNNERRHRAQERDWRASDTRAQSARTQRHRSGAGGDTDDSDSCADRCWTGGRSGGGSERPCTSVCGVPTANDMDRAHSHSYRGWLLEEMAPVIDPPRPATAHAHEERAAAVKHLSHPESAPTTPATNRPSTARRSNDSPHQRDRTSHGKSRLGSPMDPSTRRTRPRSGAEHAVVEPRTSNSSVGVGSGGGHELRKAESYRYGGASTCFAWAPVRN